MPTSTPTPNPVTLTDFLPTWLDNNHDAIAFITSILFISATWDDLIDHDTLIPDSTIHTCIELTLSLPLNPFYNQHFAALYTLLHNSMRNWKAANAIERDPNSDDNALMQAFILRSTYIDLISHCAALIKGNDWAELVTIEARLFNSREGFARYKSSLTHEKELRHGRRLR